MLSRTVAGLCLIVVMTSCGLEHRPGAVGPDVVQTSSASVSVSQPGTGFRAVDLTTGLVGFVPTETTWSVVVDEASTGQSVRILDEQARASVLIQATPTSQTAEQLCGRALEPFAALSPETPVPRLATVQPPARIHAFSCSVVGVVPPQEPDEPIDVQIDVAVDTVAQLGYVQITRIAQATPVEDRARVERTSSWMFELAVRSMG